MSDEVEQLRQELKRAHEQLARNEALLAIIAHELRNPIAPVLLALDALVLEVTGNDPLDRALLGRRVVQTRRYAQRLRTDLDRLLDFSRLRAGHLDLRPTNVDLSHVVSSCIDDLAPVIEAARCDVHTHLETRLMGSWDAMRLNQIVWNLVSNAVKYAPGARIEVTTASTPDEATLTVADAGPGIPAERHAEVFAQFERVTQDAHTGFGIGLWLVRSTVDAMGGRVTLDSTVGIGTTFTITLPRRPR